MVKTPQMKKFEYEALGFGTPKGTYPGQFSPRFTKRN